MVFKVAFSKRQKLQFCLETGLRNLSFWFYLDELHEAQCSCIRCRKFHSYAVHTLIISASLNTLMGVNIEGKSQIKLIVCLGWEVGSVMLYKRKKKVIPEMSVKINSVTVWWTNVKTKQKATD